MKRITGLMIGLEDVAGLPVEEGDYGGNAREYIVYDIADAHGGLFGDGEAQTVETDLQIRVMLEKQTEYDDVKDAVFKYLEDSGFFDISFNSYCEKETDGIFRYLIFECSFLTQKGE